MSNYLAYIPLEIDENTHEVLTPEFSEYVDKGLLYGIIYNGSYGQLLQVIHNDPPIEESIGTNTVLISKQYYFTNLSSSVDLWIVFDETTQKYYHMD